VTVERADQLAASSGQSIGQILQNKPGIASTGFAPGSDRPVIRGLTGFRVSTQENGISTGDVGALSDDHAIPIDPNSATQVEVVRGPATLRYGSQAIGGVVNATNSRIPDAMPANGIRVETRGGATSVNNGVDGSFLVEGGAGNVVLHADAFGRRSQDYETPQGRQLNSAVVAYGSSLGGSVVSRDGFVGVAYTTYNSRYDIPGGEQAESRNYLDVEQQKFTSRGEWRVNASGIDAIRTWFGYSDYMHREIDRVAEFSVGSQFKQKQYEGRVEVQHLPFTVGWTEVRGAIGAQYTNRDLVAVTDPNSDAPLPLIPRAKTENTAAYVFEEFKFSRPLTFQAAARVENSNVRGTATAFPADYLPDVTDPGLGLSSSSSNRTFVPLSGSVGVLYAFPNYVVARATAQHVERAPDATELFYRGPHDSTATFEIGDPKLKIESANTFEVGLKKAIGRLRFDASAYHTQFDNYIYKRFTGARCEGGFDTCRAVGDPDFNPGAAQQVIYSQRGARFVGAELQAEYDIAPVWRGMWGVQGQYDFVHATFDDGTFVPKIPPHRLGGGIYYYDRNITARLLWLHAFDQDEFAAFDTRTNGYDLVNAEIAYTTKLEKVGGLTREMTIGLRAENLLDDDIRNAVSYKKDQVLEPGRSIRVFGRFALD
jgi:iron complex outermembrane receptor protein